MKDIMKSLPTKHQTGVALVVLYDLTRIFPDEVKLFYKNPPFLPINQGRSDHIRTYAPAYLGNLTNTFM